MSFIGIWLKIIFQHKKAHFYMWRDVYCRVSSECEWLFFWLTRLKILACPTMKGLLHCTMPCVLDTRKSSSSWCNLVWTWTPQIAMDGKALSGTLQMLSTRELWLGGCYRSLGLLLYSWQWLFHSRATAVLCGPSYENARRRKQANYINIPYMEEVCLRPSRVDTVVRKLPSFFEILKTAYA